MIIIETCPKCGHDLVPIMLTTYPPIPKKECFHCGWSWEGQREEVVRVPFNENEEFIRGHRVESEIIDWYDYKLSKDEIDKVLEPFTAKGDSNNVKQKIYMSSKSRRCKYES